MFHNLQTQTYPTKRPNCALLKKGERVIGSPCELRNDFRAFRLDRITKINETDDQFPDEPSQNLKAYLATKIFAVEMRGQKA
jgi:predicted DNA-binding transcriptional regulator YafY